MKEINKNLQSQIQEVNENFDKWKIANYENNVAKVNEETPTFLDKTLMVPIRSAIDLGSSLMEGDANQVIDEKGNKTFLPSYNELKKQQVRESTKGLGRFAYDVGDNYSKIAAADLIDKATGGIGGKALYWTDMAADNFKGLKNEGYDNKTAIANTLISTGSEFLTEKMLGGLSKKLTGGKTSEVQKGISNAMNKLIKNPKISNVLGSMGSEGLEEFTQEWIGAINDRITLGKKIDYLQTLKDAFYSMGIGAGSAGLSTGTSNAEGRLVNSQLKDVNTGIKELETRKNNTTDAERIKNIDEAIKVGQDFANKPFTANYEDTARQIMDTISKYEPIASETVQPSTNTQETINQPVEAVKSTIEEVQKQPQETPQIEEAKIEENASNEKQAAEVQETPRKIGNRNYSSERYKNLSDEDLKVLDTLYLKQKNKEKLTQEDIKSLDYLKKKADGIKNPDLKINNTFEDLKSDYGKYIKNNNLDTFNSEFLDKAKETIQGNKQGRRTKQEWLDIAQNIGQQAENLDSEQLKKYAMESFKAAAPNQKGNLNRQGQKYVGFGIDEWVNKVYEGAGVGKPINTQNITNQQVDNKQKQFEIVNNTNPMQDEYHTGIRSKDDIRTWDEVMNLDDDTEGQFAWGDYSREDALRDKEKGTITIYSSKPIENGNFVSTSKIQAEEYAGGPGNKIYSKEVPLNEVAWINGDEGQYAKVENNNIPAEMEKEPVIKVENEQQKVPEVKQEQTFKFTKENMKDTSKDIAKELNDTFKLNKGEAYSRTPQTTVESMKFYDNAPKISDFNRETVVHTIATDEAAKTDASAKYKENGSLEENAAYVSGLLNSDKRLSKNDKALAIYTINEAYKQGRNDIADKVVSDLTVLDVEAGQWAQASKLMKQMTPLGQVQTFVKMVKTSVDKGNPRFKNVKITDAMINDVMDCYNEDGTFDNDKFAKNMEHFKEQIQSQMTPTAMDKFNSIRMLGMLGAPKTHIRNMLANFGGVSLRVIKNLNARALETAIIRDKSQRTRTFKPTTQEIKSYVDEITKSEKSTISGDKYNDTKTELQRGLKTFNENHKGMAKIVNPISKAMNGLSKGNSWLLEAEDNLFSSFAYKRSLQEFLTAQGMKTKEDVDNNPKILEKGKEFALQQALESTYRQDSNLANAISNYVKKSEKPNASKFDRAAGLLIEANLPFKKTPINIAKTGVEYSPIGLVNGIYDTFANVKSGKIEMSQAIDEISKGITGLGLLGVGALMAHNGMEITSSDDDKDKKSNYDKLLGEADYSIKIGDTYYDLSWMAPSSMPFFTGVELYQTLTKNKKMDGNAVVDTLAKTIDPLSSMSFLQGLSYTMKSYAKSPGEFFSTLGMSSMENYLSQYLPTIFSQIANVSDKYQRDTSVAGNSSFKEKDKLINQFKQKIPLARQTLPTKTDAWGRDLKNENYLNPFNAFINPANTKKDLKDKTDKELERLYYSIGADDKLSSSALPKVKFDKYLTFKGKEYDLSSKEISDYKKIYGKTAKKNVDALLQTDEYKSADDRQKAKYLESVYEYSNQKAKEQYGEKNNLDYDDYKMDQLYALVDAFNIPLEVAVTNKGIYQLKSEGGISGNKRKLAAVDDIDELDEIQKDALKRKFTMFMGNPNYKKRSDGTNVGFELGEELDYSNIPEKKKQQIRDFLKLD